MHRFHHISASYANTKKYITVLANIICIYMDDLFFQDNDKKEKKIEYLCHTDTIHLIQ